MKKLLQQIAQPQAASKRKAVTTAKAGKRKKSVPSNSEGQEPLEDAEQQLEERRALAQKIIDHRLLDRIKQYVWGVSEIAQGNATVPARVSVPSQLSASSGVQSLWQVDRVSI